MGARKRVARLMREQALFAYRPCHRTITTHSEPDALVAPNVLAQDFHANEPNTKWVADTTYIWTAEGWLYLAVVLDLFSRLVVGLGAWVDGSDAGWQPSHPGTAQGSRSSSPTSESYQALLRQEGVSFSPRHLPSLFLLLFLLRHACLQPQQIRQEVLQ